MSFLGVYVFLLENLLVIVIIALNLFSRSSSTRMKLIVIVWKIKGGVIIGLRLLYGVCLIV